MMKVIKLKATNIKAIKEAEIKPDGNLVLISGKNGQGKTSLLDCLLYALAGKKEIPSKPIRDGEEKGSIELDLGDLIVIRTFTENGTYLKVTAGDGAEYKEGQSRLNKLVKSLYFDPLRFSLLNAKEQKEMLLELIGVDISDEEKSYNFAYQERVLIGRDGKQAKGEFEGIEKPTEEALSSKIINIVDLAEEVKTLAKVVAKQDIAAQEVDKSIKRIEQLELQVRREQRLLNLNKKEVERINKQYPKLQVVLCEKEEKLSKAEEVNEKIREARRWVEQKKKVESLKEQYNLKTMQIDEILKLKLTKLKEANMPIEGLSVDENGVIFNDIPFEQLSKSEQIKVSLAIAMATDTELRMIRIMDGSLLDSDNLKVVGEMAEKRDYQVWIEVVDDSGEIGFFIEDGEVKGGE